MNKNDIYKKLSIIYKVTQNRKANIIIYILFLLLLKINTIISIKKDNLFFSQYSYITLKINGPGYLKAYSKDDVSYNPDEIFVNNINKTEEKTNSIYSYETDNNITLIWRTEPIQYTFALFKNCLTIKEIDLSNFDSRNVKTMNSMFYGCISLTSINFRNIDTSQVSNMEYMFCNCISLQSLDLSSFNTYNVKTMRNMFYNSSSLTSINLLSFDTSSCTDMLSLFAYCKSLKILDLSRFNTSLVETMWNMFQNCHELTSINISSFDASKAIYLKYMFANCTSLTNLDLSNFRTKNVLEFDHMFEGCSSLVKLDLSNFEANQITELSYMFYGCSSLISLNLSNFKPSGYISSSENLFNGCSSLIILDFSYFRFSTSIVNTKNMFLGCSKLVYANFYKTYFYDSKSNIFSYIFSLNENVIICEVSLTPSNDNSLYEIGSYCINKVYGFNNTDTDYHCYIKITNQNDKNNFSCPYLNIENDEIKNDTYNLSLVNTINTNDDIINIISTNNIINTFNTNNNLDIISTNNIINTIDSTNNLNTITTNNIINTINSNSNNLNTINTNKLINTINANNIINNTNEIINTINSDDMNYITNNISNTFNIDNTNINNIINTITSTNSNKIIEDQCYSTCKSCERKGNETYHYCIECNDNFMFELNNTFSKNCYNNCSYFYFIDINTKKYYCTNKPECPEEYNKLILNIKQCVKNCSMYNEYKYEYNNTCYNECPKNTKSNNHLYSEENIKINEKIKNKTLIIEIIKNELISGYDTSEIDKGNDYEIKEDNLLVTITNTYNQKKNQEDNMNKTIIILGECERLLKNAYKISINDSLYILKVEKIIEGMKIPKIEYEVYYPLYNNNLTQLDLSICKDTKIDIIIPVVINDELYKHDTNSDYYNDLCLKTTSEVGTDISLTDRKNEFVENNLTICEEKCELKNYDYDNKKVKCSCEVKIKIPFFEEIKFDKKELFKKFTDINNIGNLKLIKCIKYIFSKDYISKNYGLYIFIFINILFFICLIIFYSKSFNILLNQINAIVSALNKKLNRDTTEDVTNPNTTDHSIIKARKKILNKRNRNKIKNNNNGKSKSIKIKKENFPPQKKLNKKKFTKKDLNKLNVKTKDKNNGAKNAILKYNDKELNTLVYHKALTYDKRTFGKYYFSLLKMNHLLIFSFYCHNNDYNPQIIKIFLFFFFFSVHFTTNALFFDDETMHKIYIDEGSYNLVYQIPQIIYSSLISAIISIIVKYLSLSEKDIIELKNEKDKEKLDSNVNETKKFLKIKVILFFVITFIILFAFTCFVTCFFFFFVNTQAHLIKDCLVSFTLSLIYPFGIYCIPYIFRRTALNAKEKDKECLYKFSLFIQDI